MSNHITLIYNSQQDWLAVANVIKKIYLDLFTSDNTISLVDLDTISDKIIDSKLEELYNNGNRIYIGFSASELLEKCLSFFNRHSDAFCISVGSTIEKTFNNNIFRPQFSDNVYINAIDKSNILNGYNKMILIEEINNEWSHTFVGNMKDYFEGKIECTIELLNTADYTECRNKINTILSDLTVTTIIAPILSINTYNFVKVINESDQDKIKMICGDGMYNFDLTLTTEERTIFAQKASLFVTIFYGNGSIYSVIYNSPFAVNVIDAIMSIKANPNKTISEAFNNYIGYNGLLTLTSSNTRKYGKIILLSYGDDNKTGWKSRYVYDNETSFGEIMAQGNNILF